MRIINEGDRVRVWFTGGERIDGVVMHIPSNTGDLWYIRGDSGTDTAVNPQSSEFVSIDKPPLTANEGKEAI